MPETLVTCPICLIPNFTPRGLSAHRCKGGTRRNPETGLIDVILPHNPKSLMKTTTSETSCSASGEIPRNETFAECEIIQDPATAHLRSGLLSPERHREIVTQDAVEEINAFHRRATGAAEQARALANEATHFALLAGTRLEQLHASLPHGEWGKLFSGRKNPNLTPNSAHIGECAEFEFSQDTATRYIEVSIRIRAEHSLSGKAQKRLAAIAAEPEVSDDSRAWLDKLTEGKTLRQLYFDLDIIHKPEAKTPVKAVPARSPKSAGQLRLEDAREAFFLWRERFELLLRQGKLDDIDEPGLLEMKEFIAGARDRVNARLKNF